MTGIQDTTLRSDAKKLLDQRTSGNFVADDASYEDAFGALAGAMGQDTVMIYRLALEVDRLSQEVDELRRATGHHEDA